MIESLENFITDTMNILPDGVEQIRKFRDNDKWLSSDYTMSIPSRGNNQEQTVEKINVCSFQIARYPVTNQLYQKISGSEKGREILHINILISIKLPGIKEIRKVIYTM